MYWVRCVPQCRFRQAVTVEIQHCATKGCSTKLTFVRAICTQKTLPYTFKNLVGQGSFTEDSCYGSLKINHFSGIAVSAEKPVERLYTASLFYLERHICNNWEIHLVVTWDDEVHNTVSIATVK